MQVLLRQLDAEGIGAAVRIGRLLRRESRSDLRRGRRRRGGCRSGRGFGRLSCCGGGCGGLLPGDYQTGRAGAGVAAAAAAGVPVA